MVKSKFSVAILVTSFRTTQLIITVVNTVRIVKLGLNYKCL